MTMKTKLGAYVSDALAIFRDPAIKNILLIILTALSLFGVVAPDTATGLRDLVLSMAF